MEETKRNILETEPIGRLLLKFSIPTTLTLMVNFLYNIADQIFIGHATGIDGVAATNVAFPITIVAAALALLIGDGCAANISLCLGRREQEAADRTLGCACMLLAGAGLLLVLGGLCFLRPLVRLFGASPAIAEDAALYMGILLFGLPFSMCNMALTAIIRADGNPQYMMLDPIFIFTLEMGIQGAAIATIIGQIVSGVISLAYLPRFENFRIKKENLCLHGGTAKSICSLGFPSLCTQAATAATQIVMNNLMRRYGVGTIYKSEIPLSCYGIMTKIYQIAHAMFVGLASGTQPINGYNFGAKHYARVRQTYRTAAFASLLISLAWFCVFRWGGGLLAAMFVTGEPLYQEFAAHCFRLYMLGFFVYGLPQVTASFFQATGQPVKSLAVSLSRQALFLIPLAVLLSGRFGLDGALAAAPAADMLAFLLAVCLVFREMRVWRHRDWI